MVANCSYYKETAYFMEWPGVVPGHSTGRELEKKIFCPAPAVTKCVTPGRVLKFVRPIQPPSRTVASGSKLGSACTQVPVKSTASSARKACATPDQKSLEPGPQCGCALELNYS